MNHTRLYNLRAIKQQIEHVSTAQLGKIEMAATRDRMTHEWFDREWEIFRQMSRIEKSLSDLICDLATQTPLTSI